jgi:hypothetical protein
VITTKRTRQAITRYFVALIHPIWHVTRYRVALINKLGTSEEKPTTADNLLLKDRKRNNVQPAHKTTHLQTAQTDTRPKFAKELFSCRRTQAHPPP